MATASMITDTAIEKWWAGTVCGGHGFGSYPSPPVLIIRAAAPDASSETPRACRPGWGKR